MFLVRTTLFSLVFSHIHVYSNVFLQFRMPLHTWMKACQSPTTAAVPPQTATCSRAYVDLLGLLSFLARHRVANYSIPHHQYTRFVDVLADYTSLIATPWAADDKSACGQCVEVSYTNANGTTRKVYGLTVDATGGYFNFDKAGFAGLDGYGSFAAGTLRGSANTVDISKCLRAA